MDKFSIDSLVGAWSGKNHLYLEGKEFMSASTAAVRPVGQGQFLALTYTWEYDNAPHEGQILFRSEMRTQPTRATWRDSWHMANDIMTTEARRNPEGKVLLRGSYEASPGPDWHWRIEISLSPKGSLLLVMFNIAPNGEEELAVKAAYRRAGSTGSLG
jgi:hypothetical protein